MAVVTTKRGNRAQQRAWRLAARTVARFVEGLKDLPPEVQIDRLRQEHTRRAAVTDLEALESTRLSFGGEGLMFDQTDPSRDDGEVWDEVGIYPRTAGQPLMRTEQDLDRARSTCRWLAAENGYAIGAHENRISYVVGCGLKVRAVPKDTELRGPKMPKELKALQKQVQAEIDRFREAEKVTTLEQEGVRRADRDGEFLIRRFRNAVDDGVLRVRFVEPEDVRTPPEQAKAGGPVQFGIKTDPNDAMEVVSYFVAKPDAQNGREEFNEIPAKDVVHCKFNVDSNARRGWPTLYPVRRNLARAEKLLRNMAYVAAIQAAIALIVSHENATESTILNFLQETADAEVTNTATGRTDYLREMKPGTRVDLSPGQKLEGSIHNANAGDNVEVLQADLREAACRLNWPEYMFTSDASNANFASTQVAESPHVMTTKRTQGFYEGHWREVHWWAIENAIEAGRLPGTIRDEFVLQVESASIVVRDTLKEAQSNALLREHGVLSIQTWRSQVNLDDETEEANLAAERGRAATGMLGDPEDPTAPLTIEPGALGPTAAGPGEGGLPPGPPQLPAVPGAPGQPAMPGAPGAMPGGDTTVQDTAMNGAQVTALQGVVSDVAAKQLPPEAAVEMILLAFPTADEERVRRMVGAAASFTPELTPEQKAAQEKAKQPTVAAGAPPKRGQALLEAITVLEGPETLPKGPQVPFLDMLMGTNFGELRGLMRDVHAGAIPTVAAVAFVRTAFPGVPEERVKEMFSRIEVTVPALTVSQAPPTLANPNPTPAPIGSKPASVPAAQTKPTVPGPGQAGE